MDEIRRVRQPAAWLLVSGVMISVFLGLMSMLSNSWAAGVNPALLVAIATASMSGPTFADRSAVASHVFTGLPVTAMAVAAVILAVYLGEKVRHARRITLWATMLQATALFFGAITWLLSLGAPHGGAKLAFLLDGVIGIVVSVAGLYFSVVTLRSRELQAAKAEPPAGQQQAGPYPGYDYGQQGYPQQAGAQGYTGGGYQPGQQSAAPQSAALAPDTQQTVQYQNAAAQQYESAQHYGQAHSQQQVPGYGQPSHGSYGQQAYPQGYGQPAYQQGYDRSYGQQSYGQGYSSYPQSAYGQQAQRSADAYQQRSAETYQQYYQQSHQPDGSGAADSTHPGRGVEGGEYTASVGAVCCGQAQQTARMPQAAVRRGAPAVLCAIALIKDFRLIAGKSPPIPPIPLDFEQDTRV